MTKIHYISSASTTTLLISGVFWFGCGAAAPGGLVYVPMAIDTGAGRGADGVALADMDGDGDLDAVSAWEETARVRLHLQQPGGLWKNLTIAEGSSVAGVEDVAIGDLERDGAMDVVAACESGVLTWIRPGAIWSSAVIDSSAGVGCDSWIDVEIGDLNGDARPELVAACKGGGWVSIFYAAQTPASAAAFERFDVATVNRRKSSCVRLADLDEDNDLDIVSAARNETTASIAWYENPGPPDAFTVPWTKHAIGHWPDTMWIDVGDIDHDDRPDLAASSWDNASFAWFRQPADAHQPWTPYNVGQFDDTKGAGITISDLNEDGVADLVVGTYRNGRLAVFQPLAAPTGPWWPTTLATPGGRLDLVPVADVDGDGRLDIVTTIDAENGGVFWYRPWP